MDNNQTWQYKGKKDKDKPQQMQNWKKQILMDPILNTLFEPSISAQDFLIKKVMPLQHPQIAAIYAKLTSINYQLMQNIQKQVQSKSDIIQKTYLELLDYKQQLQQHKQTNNQTQQNKNKPSQYLTYLKNFNKKYETVANSVNVWKNIFQCIHFSKAIDSFKVNVNIMKTLMRGYNGNDQSINAIKIAKMIKEIVQLTIQYDFSGIKSFQAQRVFISSTKNKIHAIGTKTFPKLLQQYVNSPQQQKQQKYQIQKNIQDWINAFNNLGTLKDFVVSYGKSLLQQMAENIKKYIKNDLPNMGTNIQNLLVPFLYQSCKSLLFLQQKLILLRKVQLSNVPNLFIRFWQKLCEYLRQTITWIKKDKQRNPPKNRDQIFYWKYPILYTNLSKLCSNVQLYLLDTVLYNNYSFVKLKQRLMVNCLIELAVQYHQEKDKIVAEINKIIPKILKNIQNKQKQGNYEQNYYEIIQQKIKIQIQKYSVNLQALFQESKCSIIYNSLINKICEMINIIIQEITQNNNGYKLLKKSKSQPNVNLDKEQQAADNTNQVQGETAPNKINVEKQIEIKILTKIQVQVKGLIRKYGEGYGITKKQLQSFKVYK